MPGKQYRQNGIIYWINYIQENKHGNNIYDRPRINFRVMLVLFYYKIMKFMEPQRSSLSGWGGFTSRTENSLLTSRGSTLKRLFLLYFRETVEIYITMFLQTRRAPQNTAKCLNKTEIDTHQINWFLQFLYVT